MQITNMVPNSACSLLNRLKKMIFSENYGTITYPGLTSKEIRSKSYKLHEIQVLKFSRPGFKK